MTRFTSGGRTNSPRPPPARYRPAFSRSSAWRVVSTRPVSGVISVLLGRVGVSPASASVSFARDRSLTLFHHHRDLPLPRRGDLADDRRLRDSPRAERPKEGVEPRRGHGDQETAGRLRVAEEDLAVLVDPFPGH